MYSLRRFKDIHKGEPCVIIGNGPSLDITPLERFYEKYITFGSNRIFASAAHPNFTPDYYCIIDEDMLHNCLPLPPEFKPAEMFIRAEAGVGNPIYPIVARGFSQNLENFVIMGGTVTIALLEIAYYMGFDTFLLVGVDHSYPNAGRKIPGSKFLAGNQDPDHFKCKDGKPYFEQGKIYNAPELEATARNYAAARQLFDAEGRAAVNLTPDSKLDVFEKGKFEEWL